MQRSGNVANLTLAQKNVLGLNVRLCDPTTRQHLCTPTRQSGHTCVLVGFSFEGTTRIYFKCSLRPVFMPRIRILKILSMLKNFFEKSIFQNLYRMLELYHKKRPVAEWAEKKHQYKNNQPSQWVDLIILNRDRQGIGMLVGAFRARHADTTNGVLIT